LGGVPKDHGTPPGGSDESSAESFGTPPVGSKPQGGSFPEALAKGKPQDEASESEKKGTKKIPTGTSVLLQSAG